MLIGTISYPGLTTYLSASMTLTTGADPSLCVIQMLPQVEPLDPVGDLTFAYNTTEFTFRDCVVVDVSSRLTTSGHTVTVTIADRRYSWKFGYITGKYNQRSRDGVAFIGQQKTARELCAILLEKCGEPNVDLQYVPTDVYPTVEWDYSNPAAELNSFLDAQNLVVSLGTDDIVRIWPKTVGNDIIDDETTLSPSYSIIAKSRPKSVTVVGDRIQVQCRFDLQPVGLDVDYSVKGIDSLSYRPNQGFLDPWYHLDVSDDDARKLALQSVYRWYRIAGVTGFGGLYDIPQIGILNGPENIHLLSYKIDQARGDDGVVRALPAEIIGEYFNMRASADNTIGNREPYDGSFSIDPDTRLVKFGQPILRLANSQWTAAPIKLETSFNVVARDGETMRYTLVRNLNAPFSLRQRDTLVVRLPELRLAIRQQYEDEQDPESNQPNRPIAVLDNRGHVEGNATLQADRIIATITDTSGLDVEWAGLKPISPDGAIKQVTWRLGAGPTTTRASRNREHAPMTEQEKQQRADLARLRDQAYWRTVD